MGTDELKRALCRLPSEQETEAGCPHEARSPCWVEQSRKTRVTRDTSSEMQEAETQSPELLA